MKIFPLLLLLFVCELSGQDLAAEFLNPPTTSRPRTWMHAMSGNMSAEGMTKDLEAIAAAGQGGVLLFNIANMIPYGNVPYDSEEHHTIVAHAAKECERLGLSFGVHNCDGWTSSGGPWIAPEESMKMVVYSEQVVAGGRVNATLAKPTVREGFYRDIAVVAYPSLATEIVDAATRPAVTSSDGELDLDLIRDGKNESASWLRAQENGTRHVTFDFGKPHPIRSIYASYIGGNSSAELFVSDDGRDYTLAKKLDNPTRAGKKRRIFDDQFAALEARFFRLVFADEIRLREVDLRSTRLVDDYLAYSGISEARDYERILRQIPEVGSVIEKSAIRDLTGSVDEAGVLRATLPEGSWTVLRFGYTSTGALNWPASKWGIGLECDKFSRPALKKHFDAFSQEVIDRAQKDAPNALQYLEIDSYEMGGQNWTDNFAALFREEYGYDLIPFLPVFAGRYVESTEAVAGFTYDLNQMYVDLMTNNYFKYFTELCHENGLKSYIEPYGNGPVSTLDVTEHTDLPMTEFWLGRKELRRLKGTIMGAHVYGKPVISAEAFTARPDINWKVHPALAKSAGDYVWVRGVNEMMFHRFVHQPNTKVKPGLTMGFWGSHIDRTQTWWMNAGKAWFDYLARGSHLLRQGFHHADVLVFFGDDPHTKGVKRDDLTYPLPIGINYDVTNARALYDRFEIKDHTLVLPEGNAYKYLTLNDTEIMTLKTLRRLREFAAAGVPIIGQPPGRLAGYNRTAEDRREFNELRAAIWAEPNVTTDFDFRQLPPDFSVAGLEKDFIHRTTDGAEIYFFYNDLDAAVRYSASFRVSNRQPELWNAHTGEITPIVNYRPEGETMRVWLNLQPHESAFVVFREPLTGEKSVVTATTDHTYGRTADGRVTVASPRPDAATVSWSDGSTTWLPATRFPEAMELSTDWRVEFLAEHDYAATVDFPTLTDWKDHENEDIRYYSGTAVYTKTFDLPGQPRKDLRYQLDLGEVNIIAEVVVNGRDAGLFWMAPFRLDITDFLRPGENEVKIKLTNQWTNRLIGDENHPRIDGYRNSGYNPKPDSRMPEWYVRNEPPPAGPRVTFETGLFYKKGDPLLPSGLVGPVKISYTRLVKIDPGN